MHSRTRFALIMISLAFVFVLAGMRDTAASPSTGAEYTGDGQLKVPEKYREWVYLSTGFDMSYTTNRQAGHHMFDNVFVNPDAYAQFLERGTWPDKTIFVLEIRGAEVRGSINQAGNYQSTDVMGLDIHVKDGTRFPGKLAFFNFSSEKTSKMIPQSADCYSCHQAHAAVDTTFVQFYPTLLPIAKTKGTLSAAYQKETAGK